MPDEVEVVEDVVEVEHLPAVRDHDVNLFRADSPAEIVEKATETARVLSDVLRKQQLTSVISGREHVRVEGWTLLGTMLGVFPVCTWTRKLDDGWEARVEARTLAGAVVGAAEAECLRSERTWAHRDDYALRSMAQTRATSKALRQPLGFVVSLAGFEVTPAEEMPPGGAGKPREEQRAFDPATDLLPGAISGKDAPTRLGEALTAIDATVSWGEVIAEAVEAVWGPDHSDWRSLTAAQQKTFWRRLSNSVEWVTQAAGGDFVSDEQIVAGFAFGFDGVVVTLKRAVPEPQDVEDIPFGE